MAKKALRWALVLPSSVAAYFGVYAAMQGVFLIARVEVLFLDVTGGFWIPPEPYLHIIGLAWSAFIAIVWPCCIAPGYRKITAVALCLIWVILSFGFMVADVAGKDYTTTIDTFIQSIAFVIAVIYVFRRPEYSDSIVDGWLNSRRQASI